MRKIISFVFLITICFALFSCGEKSTPNSNNELSDSFYESGPFTLIIDYPGLTFETFELYQKFIQTTQLPSDFVPYSSISQFGEFSGLVVLSDWMFGDYSACMYRMMDDMEYNFVLYTDATPQDIPLESVTGVNLADMRTLETDSRGCYNHNGVKYNYISGKLYSIEWEHDGITYTLSKSGEDGFSKYPNTTDTIVGQLLNANVAAETINRVLNTSVE